MSLLRSQEPKSSFLEFASSIKIAPEPLFLTHVFE
jgi:hypothetical protein